MSGRRSHARFVVTPPVEGVVRVPRDVTVQPDGGNDLVVISPVPGVVDDVLIIELSESGAASSFRVQVAGSRPIMVDGVARHRLRLRVIAPGLPGAGRDRAAVLTEAGNAGGE